MLQRERRRDETRERTAGEPAAAGSDATREANTAYYNAADEAINNALSSNSETFIVQNEQTNGQ